MSKMIKSLGRRDFMKSSVAATGTLLAVKPETAFGSAANSTLKVGLLGCGGRGTSDASDFVNNTNSQIYAVADLFQDRLTAAEERFNKLNASKGRGKVEKKFLGPDAYKEITQSDVDVLIIATPPYFHPLHLKASLAGNKHTYCEKPVATDVRGCMDVASQAARVEGKLSVEVGFQIRYGSVYAEQTKRIHDGALGDIACVNGFYFAGDLPRHKEPNMSPMESKLRNWVFDRVLSGDIIVEQNIHILDTYNWILNAHPLRAQATAARKVRTDIGDVSDEYIVTLFYPNDIRAAFSSTQFLPVWGPVGWRCFGPKGFSEAFYSGGVVIKGDNPWEAAAKTSSGEKAPEIDPLGDATPNKIKEFVNSITSGNYHNQLKHGAESTLTAILARQAAYEGREISWGELLASDQHWVTDVDVDKL